MSDGIVVPADKHAVSTCECRPEQYNHKQRQFYRCKHDQLWIYEIKNQFSTDWVWKRIGFSNRPFDTMRASKRLSDQDGSGRMVAAIWRYSVWLIPGELMAGMASGLASGWSAATYACFGLSGAGVVGWLFARQQMWRRRQLKHAYDKFDADRQSYRKEINKAVEKINHYEQQDQTARKIAEFIVAERSRLNEVDPNSDGNSIRKEMLDSIETFFPSPIIGPLKAEWIKVDSAPSLSSVRARDLNKRYQTMTGRYPSRCSVCGQKLYDNYNFCKTYLEQIESHVCPL